MKFRHAVGLVMIVTPPAVVVTSYIIWLAIVGSLWQSGVLLAAVAWVIIGAVLLGD